MKSFFTHHQDQDQLNQWNIIINDFHLKICSSAGSLALYSASKVFRKIMVIQKKATQIPSSYANWEYFKKIYFLKWLILKRQWKQPLPSWDPLAPIESVPLPLFVWDLLFKNMMLMLLQRCRYNANTKLLECIKTTCFAHRWPFCVGLLLNWCRWYSTSAFCEIFFFMFQLFAFMYNYDYGIHGIGRHW